VEKTPIRVCGIETKIEARIEMRIETRIETKLFSDWGVYRRD
jgi:hypothetical protein